ncbi:MAG: hypothetical protein M0C28_38725 [Candidatus Moduliflexus flocculans]|nr:hypothetical protein [Candidatus Moduliflexus flocculans]
MKEGLTGNQVLAAALKRAKDEGLRPSIYTHPARRPRPRRRADDRPVGQAGRRPRRRRLPALSRHGLSPSSSTSSTPSPNGAARTSRSRSSRTPSSPRRGARFLDRRQTELILVR